MTKNPNHLDTLENTDKLRPSDFPPSLRNVFEVYASKLDKKTPDDMTLKEACRLADVDYDTARKQIWRQKKKGNNFWELINDLWFQHLKNNVHKVDAKLLERALDGVHRHIETFYRRVGVFDKSNEVNVNINQQFNTLIAPPADLPEEELVKTEPQD